MTARQPAVDVLLLTVTRVETEAVQAVLQERHQRAHTFDNRQQLYRNLGVIGGAQVMHIRSGQGSIGLDSSQIVIHQSITELQPRAIIMLGIAFGMQPEKQQLGDILVARQLMMYEPGRQGTTFIPRGDRVTAAPKLLSFAHAIAESWTASSVQVGLMLTGEKLVDHADMQTHLRQLEPEAIGGEMEGAGLYVAAQTGKVDWLLIKAISDWGDGTKAHTNAQPLAARNAAEFVFQMLEQGWFAPPAQSAPHTEVPHVTPPALRELLSQRLDMEEIATLCHDLGIDPDDLRGNTRGAKVLSVIQHLERRRSLPKLLAWVRQYRPDIEIDGAS